MISNRTLAIAAILALSIPALGAAAPVYANPVQEQLVEGHTVFAVLEVVDKTTTVTANFAAAVAVLVRENIQQRVANRFPGVLWFNDQYLVNPSSGANEAAPRYPCGGAVLAVNQGHQDPRTSFGPNAVVPTPLGDVTVGSVPGGDFLSNDAPYGSMPPGQPANNTPYDSNPGSNASYEDYAWLNMNGTPPYTDVLTGAPNPGMGTGLVAPIAYRESYLITDPNDHMWQIDVYDRYFRLYTDGSTAAVHQSKVWAVNVLGSPVFVPDDGIMSCPPYEDLAEAAFNAVNGTLNDEAGAGLPVGYPGSPVAPCAGPGVPYGYACADNPAAGYKQPSDNNYCYNGNAYPPTDANGDGAPDCDPFVYGAGGDIPCDGPCPVPAQPVRLYNALLYFKLQDLVVDGAPRYHDPANAGTDTNGCQVGTEWQCPGGDDNAEGYSHPFHPTTPLTGEAEECPEEFGGPNPSNHGGSTSPTYDCDYVHATKNIDIYFNGEARPFPPVVPNFVIRDTQGATAPFHYHP